MRTGLGVLLVLLSAVGAPARSDTDTDPAVTQATIHATICVRGWATAQRPPVTATEPIKRRLFVAQHRRGRLRDYRLDHVVALSLGGCPLCPANLRLQTVAEAAKKDATERRLHALVCGGAVPLASAQETLRRWRR